MIVMPMLDIRDKLRFDMSLIIADSDHRLCASPLRNENVDVLCQTNGDSP